MKYYFNNRTKIVATLGPSCYNADMLLSMMEYGVSIFRINFSHGKLEELQKVIDTIYKLSNEKGYNVGILGDLQGPKIRIGALKKEGINLKTGDEVFFVTDKNKVSSHNIFIDYENFPQDVKVRDYIYLDDGKIKIQIKETFGDKVKAEVVFGGLLHSRKGVNLPDTQTSLSCLTREDFNHLNFILENELEWVALSFVRTANDIKEIKKIIKKKGALTRVIAKIEKPQAVKNIESIIQHSDGIMIARGDLGIEISQEEVPLVQKKIISLCMQSAKPTIIATHMLENMIHSARPTRAEVSDVANAVLDGGDALMLSAETSVGKHPNLVIQTMSKIIEQVEQKGYTYHKPYVNLSARKELLHMQAIASSTIYMSQQTKAKGIASLTFSGASTLTISSMRPQAYIFVFTSNRKLLKTLNLVWGVKGFYFNQYVSTDHTIESITNILKTKTWVEKGDIVINTASMPIKEKPPTNTIKITQID